MKCDVGDIAVVLPGAVAENVGAFVTIVRPSHLSPQLGFVWWIKSRLPLKTIHGDYRTEGMIPDRFLQPIRGKKPGTPTKTATDKPEVIKA